MAFDVTSRQLVELNVEYRTDRPHVVVLGAGASLATFPTGDARGRRLPLMNNLINVLGLSDVVTKAGFNANENFEAVYSQLHAADPNSDALQQIEQRVMEYFEELELPNHPTLYDLLLLSLREKDAVFTFNWDPFLFDVYVRHHGNAPLPQIFHLHGNVRLSFCQQCALTMPKAATCHTCGGNLNPTRLLYPVEQKDYSDLFFASQWSQARDYIGRAGIITFFGYSAPTTDREAMAICTTAWKGDDRQKLIERVEIIDICDESELKEQWWDLAHADHITVRRSFYDSSLALYPRRSCEVIAHRGFKGELVEPIPWPGNLEGLKNSVAELAAYER